MKATFYKYNGEKTKLNKTLENGVDFEILLKNGNAELQNLQIALTITDNTSDFKNFNYVYIEDLKRYYFITDVHIFRNNYFIFSCREDVLMSFRADILKSIVEVTESDNIFNNDKNDYTAKDNFERIEYNFNSPFIDKKQIVLIGV